MVALFKWFSRGIDGGRPAAVEIIVLRACGVAWLLTCVIGTFATSPHPGLHGRGLVLLIALVAVVGAAVSTQPQSPRRGTGEGLPALVAVTIASAVLADVQPHGVWQSGPVFVGIIAAIRLARRTAVLALAFSVGALSVEMLINGRGGMIGSLLMTAVPWFLVMRLLRAFGEQRDELERSHAAEAAAAAAAERGRMAREMHDVLAHSLSALALQLETTRLLARNRDADADVIRAVDQAHELAAGGLDDARRAIAAARGDELPGPERIGLLADAFGQQSGLPVEVEVSGEPRELAPDARLAVYRTAQEALTNVRRHAAAERVEVKLEYLCEATVLVVEDHAAADTPPPAGLGPNGSGYGLTGMRERAALLGGELLAEPTADGFRVELRIPG
jgi:signal transduction histidine kinase